MAQAAQRRRKAELARHLPGCWPKDYDKKKLRTITVYPSKTEAASYASEAFTWHLFNGERHQNMKPLDAAPSFRLGILFDRCLPGWKTIFQQRWTPLEMLKLSDYCADAAFLNMVHMYKRVLGSKGFPPDVFAWPPTVWVTSFHSRKRKTGTIACGGGQRRAAGQEPTVVM